MGDNVLENLTLNGPLNLGGNDISMTGELSSTDERVSHGWFTNLSVSNPIDVDITGTAAGVLTNADMTGPISSVGNETSIASKTGVGETFVVDDSPTIQNPNISVINSPTSAGVSVAGRTDGSDYASGYVGEIISSPMPGANDGMHSVVTISIGSPAVITYSSHGLSTGAGVNFTTSGTLPTGVSTGVNYYIIKIDENSFWIATSVSNALAGTKINTLGSQSGSQTCNVHVLLHNGIYADANGLQLSPGVWLVNASASVNGTGGATLTVFAGEISTASATTLPFGNTSFFILGGQSISGGAGALVPTGTRIMNISTTTNVYGIVRGTFSSGGAKGCSSMVAVRIA